MKRNLKIIANNTKPSQILTNGSMLFTDNNQQQNAIEN